MRPDGNSLKQMGDIANMMLTGILCAQCGVPLDCEECADMEIPMYCSEQCARDAGIDNVKDWKYRVCSCVHK